MGIDSADVVFDTKELVPEETIDSSNSKEGKPIEQYNIQMTNDDGDVLGITTLDQDGNQSFTINGLEPGKVYKNYYLQVTDNLDIKSNIIDDFETLVPFDFEDNTFTISGITKNSFIFTMDVKGPEKYFFPTESLHLYSNDSELKIDNKGAEILTSLNNDDITGRLTYKVSKLKSNTKYSNFEISFGENKNRYQPTDPDGKNPSIKTKLNWLFIEMVSVSSILLLIIILLILYLIFHKRDKENSYVPESPYSAGGGINAFGKTKEMKINTADGPSLFSQSGKSSKGKKGKSYTPESPYSAGGGINAFGKTKERKINTIRSHNPSIFAPSGKPTKEKKQKKYKEVETNPSIFASSGKPLGKPIKEKKQKNTKKLKLILLHLLRQENKWKLRRKRKVIKIMMKEQIEMVEHRSFNNK